MFALGLLGATVSGCYTQLGAAPGQEIQTEVVSAEKVQPRIGLTEDGYVDPYADPYADGTYDESLGQTNEDGYYTGQLVPNQEGAGWNSTSPQQTYRGYENYDANSVPVPRYYYDDESIYYYGDDYEGDGYYGGSSYDDDYDYYGDGYSGGYYADYYRYADYYPSIYTYYRPYSIYRPYRRYSRYRRHGYSSWNRPYYAVATYYDPFYYGAAYYNPWYSCWTPGFSISLWFGTGYSHWGGGYHSSYYAGYNNGYNGGYYDASYYGGGHYYNNHHYSIRWRRYGREYRDYDQRGDYDGGDYDGDRGSVTTNWERDPFRPDRDRGLGVISTSAPSRPPMTVNRPRDGRTLSESPRRTPTPPNHPRSTNH